MIPQISVEDRRTLDKKFADDDALAKFTGDVVDCLVDPDTGIVLLTRAMIWRGDDRGKWLHGSIAPVYAWECINRALSRVNYGVYASKEAVLRVLRMGMAKLTRAQ